MTLQDDFVAELQHAADRVGPVAGLDGLAMGRRAVRRGRARRGALTGVGVLAAVGAVAGVSLLTGPTDVGPAASDVPSGWTPVAVGGVRLAVPPGLEPSADGLWEDDQDEGEQSFVQVQPGEDLPLVPPGSALTPTDVRIPGAVSAEYVTEDDSDIPGVAQEFLGRLQVVRESGDVVQVTLVWGTVDEGEEMFADLVRSVSVDEESAPLPSPEGVSELQQLEGFAAGVPDGWKEAGFAGLEYAVPPGWVDDDTTTDAFPAGSAFRAESGDGTAALTILQAADAAGWPDSIAPSNLYPASTFPLDGADVVQVEPRSADDRRTTTTRVRREDGRAYIVTTETPDTSDGRALTMRLLGTLGLAAGSAAVPGPDDLPLLPTSEVPPGWVEVHGSELRLAVPPRWTEVLTPDGAGWSSDPDDGQPEETVDVSTATLGDGPGIVPPPYGYRYDVPGAEHAVVQVGEQPGADGGTSFLGTVELYRGDEVVVLEYSGPLHGDSEERFGQLVRSLRLAGS
ncbi:hypothetical protein GCM10009809_18360 [Isoptericola hypogeus]|uniref:DUF4367 domain-containing protein n=1 Tax=Isoptericola hypogeus TaxID=300179 RepID=A0ABN2JCY7_9MICO